MAEKKKVQLVTSYKNDDGDTMYQFICPHPVGCGLDPLDPEKRHRSFNWADRESAVARGRQHLAEHETGADPDRDTEVSPELHDFRVARGLTNPTGTTNPDDWEL